MKRLLLVFLVGAGSVAPVLADEAGASGSMNCDQLLQESAVASALSQLAGGDGAAVESLLKTGTQETRQCLLQTPVVWNLLRITLWEWAVFFFVTIVWFGFAVAVGHWYPKRRAKDQRESHEPEQENRPVHLLRRDFEPLSYDSSLHRPKADKSEYRGFIHWVRDVVEKALSVGLILGFGLLVARAAGYLWYWAVGEGWRLVLVPIDINVALTLTGFALILDALIVVSTMTDAPGIGRTLDAVIIVLAGFVVMLVEARPGSHSLVEFRFGEPPWLGAVLALVIAFLFLVRWVVRNRDFAELRGGHRSK